MLYPRFKVNKINFNLERFFVWDTLKNTEEDVKWAQKKEEQEKKIKKNNF